MLGLRLVDITEIVPAGLVGVDVIQNRLRGSLEPAGDDVPVERLDRWGHMGTQNVDWSQHLEFGPHVLVADLSPCMDRCRAAAADEAHSETLDLDHLAVDEAGAGGKARTQRLRPVDVAVRHIGLSAHQGLGRLFVLP